MLLFFFFCLLPVVSARRCLFLFVWELLVVCRLFVFVFRCCVSLVVTLSSCLLFFFINVCCLLRVRTRVVVRVALLAVVCDVFLVVCCLCVVVRCLMYCANDC